MATLQLAANYIEGTSTFADWGHLQIVYNGLEIEVQSPLGGFLDEIPFFAFPDVRDHLDPAHTTGVNEPNNSKYQIIDLDVGGRTSD